MEVVPTNDGDDDDGVVWYRCPQCQGFLPKLKDAVEEASPVDTSASNSNKSSAVKPEPDASGNKDTGTTDTDTNDDSLPWDSPAAMMKDLKNNPDESDDDVLVGVAFEPIVEPDTEKRVEVAQEPEELSKESKPRSYSRNKKKSEPKEDAEPIMEYAAILAETDVSEAAPYRPWESYEVGQCINHLAWNDCGVVVAKEVLPGGRFIIKCYFEEAGVVRLIEQAPR